MGNKILVIGFGNILLGDEGIGVHLIKYLQQTGEYPSSVEFRDGGTSSLDLISLLPQTAYLIIVDAMKGNGFPGTVYYLIPEDLKLSNSKSLSLHQLELSVSLALANKLGYNLPTSIIGIEPENTINYSLSLSPTLEEIFPSLLLAIDKVIKEAIEIYA